MTTSESRITKDGLREYLDTLIKEYRGFVKQEYPAYFQEFPLYKPVRAIGVITHNRVYIIFTTDGKPRQTLIDVYDENDILELMTVKDVRLPKRKEIHDLLDIRTEIPFEYEYKIRSTSHRLPLIREF